MPLPREVEKDKHLLIWSGLLGKEGCCTLHPRPCLITFEAVEIGARAFWMQLRIVHEEAAQIAERAGLIVVMDRCVKMELGRYDGTMH